MAAGRRRWPIAVAVPLALAAAAGLLPQRAVVTVTGDGDRCRWPSSGGAGPAGSRPVRAALPPLLLPGRGRRVVRGRPGRGLPTGRGRLAEPGCARLLRPGRADAPRGRLAAAGAAATATLRAAAVGGDWARPAHPCRRRSSGTAGAPRRRTGPPDDRHRAAPMAAHPAGRPGPMTPHGPRERHQASPGSLGRTLLSEPC